MVIDRFEKRVPDLVHELLGNAVLGEAVRQRTGGEHGDIAVAVFLDGTAHGAAEFNGVQQVMHGAQRRNRDDLELLVFVHVAHRDQRAVFERQTGRVMSARMHAGGGRLLGDGMAECRVARVRERHVLDEMRQLVGGVNPLPRRRAVDVIPGIDQPVRVEDDNGVDLQLTHAAGDLFVAINGGLAAALVRAILFRQVHRRNVGDLGGEY